MFIIGDWYVAFFLWNLPSLYLVCFLSSLACYGLSLWDIVATSTLSFGAFRFCVTLLANYGFIEMFSFFFFFPLLSPHSIPQSWVPLKYHSSESDFSARYLQKMVAEDNSPIQFLMSPYAFYLFINAFFFCSCVVFNQRG